MAVETEIERMVVRLIGDSQSYHKMMQEAAEEAKKTADVVEDQTKKIEKFGNALKSFGTKMSLYVSTPLAGLGALATHQFGQYEAALNKMESMVGLTAEEVGEFSKLIKQVAVDTGKAPTELAAAMENITSSNIRGKDAMELLEIAGKAAASGLGETRDVTVAATTAMNVFGPANLSAKEAVDTLAQAVLIGSAEASAFAPVIGDVAQAANALGLDFKTAAGTVAFFSRTAGGAAQAATQAKGLMLQILRLKDEGQAGEALNSIGIKANELRQAVKDKGLVAAMNELDKALRENGMAMNNVFTDAEALMGALSLTGGNAEAAAAAMADMEEQVGAVDRAFEAWSKTMDARMKKVMAESKILLIELGETLSGFMDLSISWTHKAIEAWKGLSKETQLVVIGIGAFLAALGPLLVMLGTVLGSIGQIAVAVGLMKTAFMFVVTWIIGSGGIFVVMGAFMILLAKIALVVAAIYLIKKACVDTYEELSGLNAAIVESRKLSGQVSAGAEGRRGNILSQAGGMEGEDKRSFLAEQLVLAEKNARGYEQQIKGATAEVERLNTTWNRWTGNQVLEEAKRELEEVRARSEASAEWVKKLTGELQGLPEVKKAIEGGGAEGEADGGPFVGPIWDEKATMAHREMNKLTESLKIQQATMNMTATEAEIYKLSLKGLTDEQLKGVKAIADQIKVGEEHKKLIEKAKNLTDQHMTGEQKFKKGKEELNQMFTDGLITLDTYNKSMEDLRKQTDKDYKIDLTPKGVDALEAGSAEALYALEEYSNAMRGLKTPGMDMGPSNKASSQAGKMVAGLGPAASTSSTASFGGTGPDNRARAELERMGVIGEGMGAGSSMAISRQNRGSAMERPTDEVLNALLEIKEATQITAKKEPIVLAEAGL